MPARALAGRIRTLSLPLAAGLLLLTASLWAFGAIAEEVAEGDTGADDQFAAWLHGHATSRLTQFFEAVTWLGNVPVLINVTLVAALFLAWKRYVDELRLLLLAVIGAEVLTLGLKLGFRRERPFFPDPLAEEGFYSFPSGHATVSLALYGSLAFILARRLQSPGLRAACLAGAVLLVLLIGFSRLYLGVHFLSDVAAGFSAGLAWLTVCVLVLRLRRRAGAQR